MKKTLSIITLALIAIVSCIFLLVRAVNAGPVIVTGGHIEPAGGEPPPRTLVITNATITVTVVTNYYKYIHSLILDEVYTNCAITTTTNILFTNIPSSFSSDGCILSTGTDCSNLELSASLIMTLNSNFPGDVTIGTIFVENNYGVTNSFSIIYYDTGYTQQVWTWYVGEDTTTSIYLNTCINGEACCPP